MADQKLELQPGYAEVVCVKRARIVMLATLLVTLVLFAINTYFMFSAAARPEPRDVDFSFGRYLIALNVLGLIAIVINVLFVIRPLLQRARAENRLYEAAHVQSLLPKAWLDRSGRLLRVNQAFCNLLGWDERDLIGQPFESMVKVGANNPGWADFLSNSESLESDHSREFGFVHRDGHMLTVIVTTSTLRDDNGQAVCDVLHVQDVTARSRVERDLRASEARFRAFAKSSPLGIFITDSLGQCIFANDVYMRLTGLSFEDLRGEGWIRALHPDDREQVAKSWGRFALQGGEFDQQYRYLRPDKSVYWVRVLASAIHEELKVIGYIGMVENITHQRESDLALRESEKRFRKLADSVPALIWMDDHEKTGAYINKAWVDYTGNAELGNAWIQSVHPEDLSLYLQRTARAWDRRESYRLEYRLRRNDGEYRWFVVTAIPLFDDIGVFSGYIGSCVDIHDSKLAQQELQNAKERAEAASVAKSNFLANISHEFRTPMTAILGYADLLQSPGASDLTPQECVQSIMSSGQHLLAMLNDILDLSKVEAGELAITPTPCDIAKLCHDVVEMMRPRALEKGLEFGVRLLTPLPAAVETDAMRLTQILVNVVGNAIKFTDEGSVRLSVRASVIDQNVRFLFIISDTGVGIRPDQVERLFTPFFQADESSTRRHGGTGLGLAISRRLAQRLGGDLTAQSDGTSGSIFTLTLTAAFVRPAYAAARTPVPVSLVQADAPTKLGRILVAEDGTSTRKLLDAILRHAGADVVTCEDGQTAFELALEQRFDVIVLDMLMPELDGYTVARSLRARGCRTPIVALTANAMSGDRERCISAGCDDYLSKPIDREKLIQTLARYCGVESNSSRLQSANRDLPAETVSELKLAFFKELAGDCDRLEQRLQGARADELQHILHQIKGSTAAFGFDDLSQLAADAEKSLKAGPTLTTEGSQRIVQLLAAMRESSPAVKQQR